jgi:hypothetical protein
MKDMPDDRRRHLRGAAREFDQSHSYNNFHQEYADANDANMAQKQEAADQKKKKTDQRLKDLQEFKPVLDFEGKVINDARVEHMKTQLRWHRIIDGDDEIPKGFHSFNKQKLWDTVNQAVKRFKEKNVGNKGK